MKKIAIIGTITAAGAAIGALAYKNKESLKEKTLTIKSKYMSNKDTVNDETNNTDENSDIEKN